jgi:hypothetical protein
LESFSRSFCSSKSAMIFPRRSNVGFAPILGIVVNVRDLRAPMSECRLSRAFFGEINFSFKHFGQKSSELWKEESDTERLQRRWSYTASNLLGSAVTPSAPNKQAAEP